MQNSENQKIKERKLSKLQRQYRNFFLKKLEKFGVSSPARLSNDKKREFFTQIREEWSKIKNTNYPKLKKKKKYKKEPTNREKKLLQNTSTSNTIDVRLGESQQEIIISKPNPNQNSDLRINFEPIDFFSQSHPIDYPFVSMPNRKSLLKLPREGRSNNKGFVEDVFHKQLVEYFSIKSILNNEHLSIPNFNRPYEPDMIFYDEDLNLYIDIEIDEPYDGYYRYPTHYRDEEHVLEGKDRVRDLFFNESGWVVIRFTERQVHLQSSDCISFISDVIESIRKGIHICNSQIKSEPHWDFQQSIRWEKERYRERYLGIDAFGKAHENCKVVVPIENEDLTISRTPLIMYDSNQGDLAFDGVSHTYVHKNDRTGNAEYLSVTSLISRFFPFDLENYFQKVANEENIPLEKVRFDFELKRKDASDKGTELHELIEFFLNDQGTESTLIEFQYFKDFYQNEIIKRELEFVEAEKKILHPKYNVAGTVDAIFKKKNENSYIIFDWKRSKKLIIDGHPDKRGYSIGLDELAHLNNCSYFRYLLQQNIYKNILEEFYNMPISSMHLVILHEEHQQYHRLKLEDLNNEVKSIFSSINQKR